MERTGAIEHRIKLSTLNVEGQQVYGYPTLHLSGFEDAGSPRSPHCL
jgi:hypothetical protein